MVWEPSWYGGYLHLRFVRAITRRSGGQTLPGPCLLAADITTRLARPRQEASTFGSGRARMDAVQG